MKIKKIIFSIALLSLISLPFLSYAQFGIGVQSQIAPNTGGPTVGSNANITPNTGGPTVGTKAQFSTSGILCKLPIKPTFGVLLGYITCLLSGYVIPLIFSLAIVMFIWGVVQYVINTDDEGKKQKGKNFMIWGIIALTVMTSVWGLVKVVGNTFGIKYALPALNTTPPQTNTVTNNTETILDQNSSTNTIPSSSGNIDNTYGGLVAPCNPTVDANC